MPGWLAWAPGGEDPASILKHLGVRHLDEDILTMLIERLRQEFDYATTEGLQITPFFRKVIWQL